MAKKGIHPRTSPRPSPARAATRSRPSRRAARSRSKSARAATRSTRASRSSSTPPAASSASRRSTARRTPSGAVAGRPATSDEPRPPARCLVLDELLLDKLAAVEARYEELSGNAVRSGRAGQSPADAEAVEGALRSARARRHAARSTATIVKRVAEARELQKDPEMRDLARQEETELGGEQERLEKRIEGAAPAARIRTTTRTSCSRSAPAPAARRRRCSPADLFRMYTRFAERHRWKVEILSMLERVGGRHQGGRGRHQRPAAPTRSSSTSRACTACSACPRPRRRGASTPRRRPWR